MKYLLTLVLSIFISFGAMASKPQEDTPLLRGPAINSTPADVVVVMKDDAPRVPLGYRAGKCYGKFLKCWTKDCDDEEKEGPGLLFQKCLAFTGVVGTCVSGYMAWTTLCCGKCGCCMNGNACCVHYVNSCCCFCGNGGCIAFAKWAGIATAGWLGCATCCGIGILCCQPPSYCEQALVAMHCMNCAKGFSDGYSRSKKMDDGEGSQPSPSSSFQANAGQPA